MRTLYLQAAPSSLIQRALWGEHLYSLFRARSDECLLSYLTLDHVTLPLVKGLELRDTDAVDSDLFRQLDPDVVYMERGLFVGAAGDYWRIPERVARGVCERGGVIIIADLDANIADREKSRYSKVGTFMKSQPLYHQSLAFAERPREFRSGTGDMPMRIPPDSMKVDNWLKPALYDVPEILVANPVVLHDSMARLDRGILNVAASGGHGSKVLDLDRGGWFSGPTPFACVDRLDAGYVVIIAASVSDDFYQSQCPHNGTWILQLAQLLLDKSAEDRRRVASPLRASATLFLSHGSRDKSFVNQVNEVLRRHHGLNTWVDEAKMFPSDSLPASIAAGLAEATHVILFWSKASAGRAWVKRELKLATRGRNRGKPVIVVRLDTEPPPASLGDPHHIDAVGKTPDQIAQSVASAINKLGTRSRRRFRMHDT